MPGKVDQGYLGYLPLDDRPTIRWPNNARLALWVAPNIEIYEFEPPPNDFRAAWGRTGSPDPMSYAYRDYGNRVGFWRMLDVLDAFEVRPTASLNLAVLEHLPEVRHAMLERDWELMSHGIYNTRYLFGMSEADEREFYDQSIALMRKHTGDRPRGMLGPSFSATPNTSRLMAEAGFTYQVDWFVDDQPFPVSVPDGKLVGVPYTREINDALMFNGWPYYSFEADEFLRACKAQFDVLYEEGAESGRVMCISLHPFYIGRPGRIRYLREALEYVTGHDGVWMATAGEIADFYLEHYYEEAVQSVASRDHPGGFGGFEQ